MVCRSRCLRTTLSYLPAVALGLAWGAVFDARADDLPPIEIVPQLGHSELIEAAVFSPDGKTLLSGSDDKTLKLWDVASGRLIRELTGHTDSVQAVAISPDGRTARSVGRDNTLKVWDLATGHEIATLRGHSGAVSSVPYLPDGKALLWGDSRDQSLKVWDVENDREILTIKGPSWANPVAVSPDGKTALSADWNKSVKYWDLTSGKLVRELRGHSGNVKAVAFSPDGLSALSCGDEKDDTLRLWDLATGREVRTFKGHYCTWSTSVAFSPDGKSAIAPTRRTKSEGRLHTWTELTLLDLATGAELQAFDNAESFVVFSPDGLTAVSNEITNKDLILWDLATGRKIRRFEGRNAAVQSVGFSPEGSVAFSGNGDLTIKVWDLSTGREIRQLKNEFDISNVFSIALARDGKIALSGTVGAGYLNVWDLQTGQKLHQYDVGLSKHSHLIAISPDTKSALIGGDPLALWDLASGRKIRELKGSAQINAVAILPDGKTALSGGFGLTRDYRSGPSLTLWDLTTGRVIRQFNDGSVKAVAVSADGKRALSGDDENKLKLWDLDSGRELREFIGHSAKIDAVAFSADGKTALSGSDDHTLKLWDLQTGAEIREFKGHAGGVTSVAFSPDGRTALSGSLDGSVRVWDLVRGGGVVTMLAGLQGDLAITPSGFFASTSESDLVSVVRGFEVTTIGQVHQSLFSPDLVREVMAGDPIGEVKRAAEVIDLDKVLESGPPPLVDITSNRSDGTRNPDLVVVEARIRDRGKGIGRIEWRVNGITTGVVEAPAGAGPEYVVRQTVALDPGKNAIEVVAYNAGNLLASLPAKTNITYSAPANVTKPKLFVLAIGINAYHDKGWTPPGTTKREYFPPLTLAVDDARALAEAFKEAGSGLYGDVIVRTALDEEATAKGLERIVNDISAAINPRDTFVLFAAAHGYSSNGRFYLLPQDYQGGTDPAELSHRAIGQDRLQEWIAKINARRGIILLDTCESGALTNGYEHSRIDSPASEAAVGRLHEATGRPVLTAAAAGKPAFEGYRGHGVFTWALIDALFHGDTNGDGLIELSELATYVENSVPKISAEMNGRGAAEIIAEILKKDRQTEDRQTAHFGSTGGDFPLVRRLQ